MSALLDVEPEASKELHVVEHFNLCHNSLKCPPFSFDACIIDPDTLDEWCSNLREGSGKAPPKPKKATKQQTRKQSRTKQHTQKSSRTIRSIKRTTRIFTVCTRRLSSTAG